MKHAPKTRERLFTVFFMLAVTFVSISLVSGAYLVTAGAVSRNAALFRQRAVLAAAGLPVPVRPDEARALYESVAKGVPDESAPVCYQVTDPSSRQPRASVFIRDGAGLWGRINMAVGLDPALSNLTGLAILDQNETPGLGARIAEDWFLQQFRGKRGPLKLVPEGTRSSVPEEMDAITGATITTGAVRDTVNRVLADAPKTVPRETR